MMGSVVLRVMVPKPSRGALEAEDLLSRDGKRKLLQRGEPFEYIPQWLS